MAKPTKMKVPTHPFTSTLVPIPSEQSVVTLKDGGQRFPMGRRQEERQRSNVARELKKLGLPS